MFLVTIEANAQARAQFFNTVLAAMSTRDMT